MCTSENWIHQPHFLNKEIVIILAIGSDSKRILEREHSIPNSKSFSQNIKTCTILFVVGKNIMRFTSCRRYENVICCLKGGKVGRLLQFTNVRIRKEHYVHWTSKTIFYSKCTVRLVYWHIYLILRHSSKKVVVICILITYITLIFSGI